MMGMSYDELKKIYIENFSLGYLNTDINNKFALISLICYITMKAKMKKPDVTTYQIIMKIYNDLPEDFIKALAIICDDFSYGCTEFPTFGIQPKDMIDTIKNLLKSYLPF
jgi:hypothetical protein